MRSRAGFLVAGAFLLAAVGCGDDGGGGGALEAFCDELDAFSEDVTDGDLTSNRGLDNLVDRVNELIELADDDQADGVEAVGELLTEARPDDAAEVAEEIQDELGDIAEDDCELDDFAAFEVEDEPDETTTSTTEPEDEETTTAPPVDPPPGGGAENPVTAAIDPAGLDIEPGFEENIDLCFRGFMQACDDIFFGENGQTAAPQGTNARTYGGTCGGRILEFLPGAPQRCVDNLFGAGDFDPASFTDPAAVSLADACRGSDSVDGDMAACDQLFLSTGIGTAEEAYGDTCGGRIGIGVADRQASCVAIWGPVAEFG